MTLLLMCCVANGTVTPIVQKCIIIDCLLQLVVVVVSPPREVSGDDTGLVVCSVHTKHLLFSLFLYHLASCQNSDASNNTSLQCLHIQMKGILGAIFAPHRRGTRRVAG
jgi:hypothetical protein